MNKNLLAPVLAVGLSFGAASCGGEKTPESVLKAYETTMNFYGCDSVDPAKITVSDLAKVSIAAFGDESGLALTDVDGIRLDDDLSESDMARYVIHEAVHWCSDHSVSRSYDERVINVPGVGILKSSEGFVPLMNNEKQGNTFVEEGVTDWLALGIEGYEKHENYASTSDLTDAIARLRGLSREQISELHKADDFLGLIGLYKGRGAETISGGDILEIVRLYMDTYEVNQVPDDETLKSILSIAE